MEHAAQVLTLLDATICISVFKRNSEHKMKLYLIYVVANP